MFSNVSMQTKILGLVTGLILLVSLLLTVFYAVMEYQRIEQETGEKGLRMAQVVAKMPSVRNAFDDANPEVILQPIATEVRILSGAEYVVIGNTESIRYAHPDPDKIGKKMVGGDNDRALVGGESYISEAVGSLGPAVRGKAPILDYDDRIVGVVSVGYMVEDTRSIIRERLGKIIALALLIIVIGMIGGIRLADSIRKDTMGLEPAEIASLYTERTAILSSVHEGIIAVDKAGEITMLNDSARRLLGLSEKQDIHRLDEVNPNRDARRFLRPDARLANEEAVINDRHVIVNALPVEWDGQPAGAVFSFRDKTELKELVDTLSEVREYSEYLRAQTHEYTNKLYVLSGLMQLGKYNEAIELISDELDTVRSQNRILFTQIQDPTVQAILMGKIGKASENKIRFTIDDNSGLGPLPGHIGIAQIVTILGNLLDNAMEEVRDADRKEVSFFATDIGQEIVFEVADSGGGLPESDLDRIYERGYSTKASAGRGYGLSLVRGAVDELGGYTEAHNSQEGGAVFTVFIPKQTGGVG
ncbi:ATP-binding protein [Bhargavaea beijingensis]|uniref:ATP-binding protein n=1 Tax=Bhargavaea beijingensis TaxID=426756 RepID=UPI0022240100|nr:sensor histidine kinase [Bhargavaea beijingensis]MCW1927351.1 sensor histidine kinase [Bhargavaea beijingensis]